MKVIQKVIQIISKFRFVSILCPSRGNKRLRENVLQLVDYHSAD